MHQLLKLAPCFPRPISCSPGWLTTVDCECPCTWRAGRDCKESEHPDWRWQFTEPLNSHMRLVGGSSKMRCLPLPPLSPGTLGICTEDFQVNYLTRPDGLYNTFFFKAVSLKQLAVNIAGGPYIPRAGKEWAAFHCPGSFGSARDRVLLIAYSSNTPLCPYLHSLGLSFFIFLNVISKEARGWGDYEDGINTHGALKIVHWANYLQSVFATFIVIITCSVVMEDHCSIFSLQIPPQHTHTHVLCDGNQSFPPVRGPFLSNSR